MRNLPIKTYLCSSLSIGLLILIWHLSTTLLQIPDYLLPAPAAVFQYLVYGFASGELWPHILETLKETAVGYVIGCSAAIFFGALLAESKLFEDFLYPVFVGLQATPKVALGPIILVWFGFGIASKIVLVSLVCFFPLFINTVNGLKKVDSELIDTVRSFSASRLYLLLHVKIPSAAGTIFSGLQIAVALALIGAVVAEFLSAERGLGYLIASASVSMNISAMFAGVLLLSVIGLAGTWIVRLIHRRIVFWE